MKNIEEMVYHDKNYDIDIRSYLTNAEIQAIAKSVSKYNTWVEKQENKDALLLHFATDIGDENIEQIGIANLLKCGLVDSVYANVHNLDRLYDAIKFEENETKAKEMAKQIAKAEKELIKSAKESSKK